MLQIAVDQRVADDDRRWFAGNAVATCPAGSLATGGGYWIDFGEKSARANQCAAGRHDVACAHRRRHRTRRLPRLRDLCNDL